LETSVIGEGSIELDKTFPTLPDGKYQVDCGELVIFTAIPESDYNFLN